MRYIVANVEHNDRYIPLTRVNGLLTGDNNIAALSTFPSLSTGEEVEKVASSSIIVCKVGSAEAVAKVCPFVARGSVIFPVS